MMMTLSHSNQELESHRHVYVIVTSLIYIFTNFNLDYVETNSLFESITENLLGAFNGFQLQNLSTICGIWLLLRVSGQYLSKKDVCRGTVVIPAVLFSFFMVFGRSFSTTDSWIQVIVKDPGQCVKAALVFGGYTAFFCLSISLFYCLLDRLSCSDLFHKREQENDAGKVKKLFFCSKIITLMEKYPFRTAFFVLLILYIPYMYVSYPAIFMGDTRTQIRQAFSVLKTPGNNMNPENLLSDSVFITQHHPVVHTLFIHLCLIAGDKLFQSFNAGIFFYCLVQSCAYFASLSYGIKTLIHEAKNKKAAVGYGIILLLWFYLHPLLHNYVFLVTKDILNVAFWNLFMIQEYKLLKEQKHGLSDYIITGIAIIGAVLFRNDSKYILLFALVIGSFIDRRHRRLFAAYACEVIAIEMLIFHGLFIMLDYTPGSIREMLSVPFQQTARYVSEYPDEVTEEEKRVIDSVLDFDSLADNYNPDISDPVKRTYRGNGGEALKEYLLVWAKMFKKHPEVYVQATMNNYYQYFYPDNVSFHRFSYRWSDSCIQGTNEAIAPLDRSFSYPEKTNELRIKGDKWANSISRMPGFSMIMTPALYNWLVVLLLFYEIRKANASGIVFMLPLFAMILICILGPTNGYYGRYTYPLAVLLPYVFTLLIKLNCIDPNKQRQPD